MKIISIHYTNFRGLKDFTFEPNGKSVSVFGTNETGKSTLLNGFLWLITNGKDQFGRTNYEIMPLDKNNQTQNVEASVEAQLVHDDVEICLRKEMSQKWTKPRGQAKKILTGNEFKYFIDGVPKTETQYKTRIADLCGDEKIFRIITDPSHFNDDKLFKWTDRRALLLDLAGDISNDDIIASNKDLEPLSDILGNNSIDDQRAIIRAQRTKINDRISEIPVSIKERDLVINEVGEPMPKSDIIEAMKAPKRERERVQNRLDLLLNGGSMALNQKELASVEAKIQELKNKKSESNRLTTDENYQQKTKLEQAAEKLSIDINTKTGMISRLQRESESDSSEIENIEAELKILRDSWHQKNDSQFQFNQESKCPSCGYDLLSDAKRWAEKNFNSEKAQSLKLINDKGKKLSAKKKTIEAEIIERGLQINQLKVDIKQMQSEHAKAIEAISNFQEQKESSEFDQQIYKLEEKKQQIEKDLADLQESEKANIESARQEISEFDAKIEQLQSELAKHETIAKAQNRIEALMDEERKLSGELEGLEKQLHLIEMFERARADAVNEAVSGKFQLVKWKMFKENLTNDGIEACCIATKDGIPYGACNTASQICMDIDISNAFSKQYGIDFPVFIDRAESIINILPSAGQQIRLVVSKADKSLRIE